MKLFLVGLLVCVIAGIGAQLSDDAESQDGVQDDPISPVSWINLFSKLTAFMHAKKDPDIGVQSPTNHTIPDQPLDDHAVDDPGNDDGYDVGTTVVYENVTVTDISIGEIEGGETKSANHSEAVSPVTVTSDITRSEGSNGSAAETSATKGTASPNAENGVQPTPPFLNPNLSLKEAIALFRDYQEQETMQSGQKGDGQRQEQHNSTVHTGTTPGQPDEETLSSLPGEMMQPQINETDGYDSVGELENLVESKSNFTQLSPNSTLSNYTVSNRNESQTDLPGMNATSSPLGVSTPSLTDSGQNAYPNPGNATTDLDASSPASSANNTPSLPTVYHNPLDLEVDDVQSQSSPDHGVVEASTESTSTQLPRQFWIANDKGDDDDSDSKENNFIDDMDTSLSTSSSVNEGEIERLSDITTPKCDWMGSNKSNTFIKLIDRLCHTLKPLPIVFNVLILLTLGIISVVVCRVACLCIRRRRKRGEDKDSLIEPGSRKEKKSLLQV